MHPLLEEGKCTTSNTPLVMISRPVITKLHIRLPKLSCADAIVLAESHGILGIRSLPGKVRDVLMLCPLLV
jgi:hypothetical protein